MNSKQTLLNWTTMDFKKLAQKMITIRYVMGKAFHIGNYFCIVLN